MRRQSQKHHGRNLQSSNQAKKHISLGGRFFCASAQRVSWLIFPFFRNLKHAWNIEEEAIPERLNF